MDTTGWDTDAGSLFWFLVPGVVAPMVLLVLAFWQPTKRQVLRWGAACDVVITDVNREQVRRHLGRVRRYRSAAAFPFWWLIGARLVDADFPSALASPLPALAAYVGAGLVADATSPLPEGDGSIRHATLLQRSVADYVPRWARALPWALVGIGGAVCVLGRDVADTTRSSRSAAVVVAAAAVLALGAELVARYLVRRPQRGIHPDVLAADDGLRAAGISWATAGAALAGLVAAYSGVGSATPMASGLQVVPLLAVALGVQALGIGLLCCIVRQETWGYRRRHRQQAPLAVPA